jgi:hypothetical protein
MERAKLEKSRNFNVTDRQATKSGGEFRRQLGNFPTMITNRPAMVSEFGQLGQSE